MYSVFPGSAPLITATGRPNELPSLVSPTSRRPVSISPGSALAVPSVVMSPTTDRPVFILSFVVADVYRSNPQYWMRQET